VVYNFNKITEPEIENSERIIRTSHFLIPSYPAPTHTTNLLAIGPQKPFIKIGKRSNSCKPKLESKEIFVSDFPDDYFHLYANGSAVYSNMIHPCIATLSLGNYARIYSTDPRVSLLDRAGIGEIRKNLLNWTLIKLNMKKENQLSFLREILEG